MPVQQHPLPQDISSYHFRLIGDMTLKQFLYLGGFIVSTILIHKTPLPFFFKYPLEITSLALGIGLAFVPVQGRPLDKWIIAFIKSIYSPTQYTWQQQTTDQPSPTKTPSSLPSPTKESGAFSTTKPQSSSTTSYSPALDTSFRKSPLTPTVPSPSKPSSSKLPKTSSSPTSPPSSSQKSPQKHVQKPSSKLPPSPPSSPVTPSQPTPPTSKTPSSSAKPPLANLPIPFTPDAPNTLVGLTLTPTANILDNVLVEIISNNLTIRATKSNKLGQFLFAKPLPNGTYQIKAEKDGYQFDTYSLSLTDKIVKPLKIQAKSTSLSPLNNQS